jgi:hypothetical protein
MWKSQAVVSLELEKEGQQKRAKAGSETEMKDLAFDFLRSSQPGWRSRSRVGGNCFDQL